MFSLPPYPALRFLLLPTAKLYHQRDLLFNYIGLPPSNFLRHINSSTENFQYNLILHHYFISHSFAPTLTKLYWLTYFSDPVCLTLASYQRYVKCSSMTSLSFLVLATHQHPTLTLTLPLFYLKTTGYWTCKHPQVAHYTSRRCENHSMPFSGLLVPGHPSFLALLL